MSDRRNFYAEGLELAKQDRLAEALEMFSKVTDTSPDYENALVEIGAKLMRLGMPDEAATHCAITTRKFPRNLAARIDAIAARAFAGEYEEMLAACEEGLKYFPQKRAIFEFKAEALEKLGRKKEAEVIRAGPLSEKFSPDNLRKLMSHYTDNGDYDAALDICREAAQKHPGCTLLLSWHANMLLEAGRYDQCEAECRKLMEMPLPEEIWLDKNNSVRMLNVVKNNARGLLGDIAAKRRREPMRFTDYICRRTVIFPGKDLSVEQIARELTLRALEDARAGSSEIIEKWADEVANACARRQEIGSTSVGNGAAFVYPDLYDSIKDIGLSRTFTGAALFPSGTRWHLAGSGKDIPVLDDKPVKAVWFVLPAITQGNDFYQIAHIKLCAKAAQFFSKNSRLIDELAACGNESEAIDLLKKTEGEMENARRAAK